MPFAMPFAMMREVCRAWRMARFAGALGSIKGVIHQFLQRNVSPVLSILPGLRQQAADTGIGFARGDAEHFALHHQPSFAVAAVAASCVIPARRNSATRASKHCWRCSGVCRATSFGAGGSGAGCDSDSIASHAVQ